MYVLTAKKITGVGSSKLVLDQLDVAVEGVSDVRLMKSLTSKLEDEYRLARAYKRIPFTDLARAKPPTIESFSIADRDDFRVLVLRHAVIEAIGEALGFHTDDPLYAYWNPQPPLE